MASVVLKFKLTHSNIARLQCQYLNRHLMQAMASKCILAMNPSAMNPSAKPSPLSTNPNNSQQNSQREEEYDLLKSMFTEDELIVSRSYTRPAGSYQLPSQNVTEQHLSFTLKLVCFMRSS